MGLQDRTGALLLPCSLPYARIHVSTQYCIMQPRLLPSAPSAHSSGRATSPSFASVLPRRHLESSDQIISCLCCININQQLRWFVPSIRSRGLEFRSSPRREFTTFFLIFVSLTADSWAPLVSQTGGQLSVYCLVSILGPAGQRPGLDYTSVRKVPGFLCFAENCCKCVNLAKFITFNP
jgi:hypothetical protein